MELTQILKTRWSIKSFLTRPVPREMLLKLVDNARYSLSGNKKKPWRFVLITGRGTLDRLSETHRFCRWLASAQAGIAIVATVPSLNRYWLEDCCIATYSIWLTATDQELGVAWGAMYQSDDPLESERRQRFVREALSIPDSLFVPMVLGVVYAYHRYSSIKVTTQI